MADRSFGAVLRNERERQGLSLDQATQGTRIRLQILEAFEDCDFEAMPPKGYAQNMIGSYARWLGLDPRKVVELYLDDLDEYNRENHDFASDPYSNYGRRSQNGSRAPQPRERSKRYQHGAGQQRNSHRSSRSRSDGRGYISSVDDRGRRKNASSLASEYTGTLHYSPVRGAPVDNIPSRNGHSPRASRIFAGTRSRWGFLGGKGRLLFIIAAVIVILIIAALIASYVTSCSRSKDAVETPTVNTETVQTNETAQTGTTTTSDALAAPFSINFTVAEGQTSDATILVDGMEAYVGTAIGPITQTYDVSTSVDMTFTNPDAVTITLGDGSPVDIVRQEDGTGKVALAVTSTTQGEAAPEATPEGEAAPEGEPAPEEAAE